ncbi:MAG: chlororespiratory reduction protein 7 [Acaryochloridaceae cyanobacterium RU_4_10]|nr:chlororespiratory reduction protein 7 [Acaryochloridaceae cyanobacterium RU_4_10]
MPDTLMYQPEETFVVLETDRPEVFLSSTELLGKLKDILANRQNNLPADLQKIESLEAQAQHLMQTGCDLDLGPDRYLQWYVVRLEK